MPMCSIQSCGLRKSANNPELTIHRFPKTEELKAKWMEAIGEENLNPRHRDLYVCSRHFEDNCFYSFKDVMRLQEDVVPTKFLTTDENEKMKSKIPPTSKITRSLLTCDVCKGKFQTIQALRSHQLSKHRSNKRIQFVTKPKEAVSKAELIDETPSTARISKRILLRKNTKEAIKENIQVTNPLASKPPPETQTEEISGDMVKTEFECPECNKMFPVYFSAMKHIQKKHIVDEEDVLNIELRPIQRQVCTLCLDVITTTPHKCEELEKVNTYKCLGCEKQFLTVAMFNKHVEVAHSEGVDDMLFRGIHDFSTWKLNMENQVKVKYAVLDKTTKNQYYQCNYVSDKNMANVTYLCPSLIVTEDGTDGKKVKYYSQHSGHTTPKYSVLDEFRNHLVSDLNDLDTLIKTQNVYQKFKNLMETIVTDAAKTNLENLKKLSVLAIDMQKCLDDHEKQLTIVNKNMSDKQITEVLEERVSKRKTNSTLNSFSNKKQKVEEVFSPKCLSPSFNDSYRQFIDKNEGKNLLNKKETSKKEVPKKEVPKKEVVKKETPKREVVKKEIVKKETPKREAVKKEVVKKEIVKTKIGQFSPKKALDHSPKRPNILKQNTNTAIVVGKVQVKDLKYEVREQENDCNILVLKI